MRGARPLAEIRVGLLGFGTVGRGVLEVLERNAAVIEHRAGARIEVARVLVRDPHKDRGMHVPSGLLTDNPQDILGDPSIRVVVELIGGVDPALRYITSALGSGKAVITANKDVIAAHGAQLAEACRQGRADLFFEASVGGGIPIVRALSEGLAGNRLRRIVGILNGTTNFILSRMTAQGLCQEDALDLARRRGYAEADPSADLDGWDAARKIAILSSIGYSAACHPDDVYREGIRDITAADIAHAGRMGWTIKLLGIAERLDGQLTMRVHPTFVPRTHPLAAVSDAFNAIYIQGDPIGETMLYGPGAGGLPTASAVIADLIDAVRWVDRGGKGTEFWNVEPMSIGPIDDVVSRFYVRLGIPDRVGVLAQIAGVFGQAGVSILSVLQSPAEGNLAELVIVTHEVREQQMRQAVTGIAALDVVERVASVIRLAPEDL